MHKLCFIDDDVVVRVVSDEFNFGAFYTGRHCCGTTVLRIHFTVVR